MWGSASDISLGSYASYHLDGYIKNTCTASTLNGGEWGADFDAECDNEWINQGSITGNLPALSVGQQRTIVDGNYKSVCIDSQGDIYPPQHIDIYLSSSAYLTGDKGIVTGSSTIEVY
jgi:hypothetical protein